MTTLETQQLSQAPFIRYDLDENERLDVFACANEQLHFAIQPDATNVLVVPTNTELANYVRSVESESLPTIPKYMKDYEHGSRFVLVLQDTEEGVVHTAPAHTFRIQDTKRLGIEKDYQTVGLLTFDDALKQGKVTVEQLLEFYEVNTLEDLGKEYINVETNIANKEVPFSIKRPYSALGYRAIFEIVNKENYRGVVAYQNPEAIKSLSHLGLVSVPLVGNPEISVEDEDKPLKSDGGVDEYFPLTVESVPWSKLSDGSPEHNLKMFTDPEYAKTFSRIAALVASKKLNVITVK